MRVLQDTAHWMASVNQSLRHRGPAERSGTATRLAFETGLSCVVGAMPGMGSTPWALPRRYLRTLRPLLGRLSAIYEPVAFGIRLGLAGAALVACAIPILACIPPSLP